MKKLSIVTSIESNYVLQTRVAIWSMLNAAQQGIFFDIYIFCTCQLGQREREKIYDLQNQWDNIKIRFVEMDTKIFQNAKTVSYMPVATFYRLIIGNIVDDERCLYVDVDIIVNVDLTQIYDMDLTGKYLAGVRDSMLQCDKKSKSYGEVIGIPTMEGYVNAGVLLLNLDLIRKDEMVKEFLSCMDDYYKMMDQDILNKCCFGKIEYLDLKYNFFSMYYKNTDKLKNTSFTQKEIEDAEAQIGIMHYAGKYKPWNFMRISGSHIWWENAKKALALQDYNELYEQAMENTQRSDWQYILSKCEEADDIMIIGFSNIGKDVADSLIRCGIKSIRCFCDNDKEKQLLKYDNVAVYSIDEAYDRYPQALWVNTSQVSAKEINKQLSFKGIEEDSILVYINKSEQYYDSLDEEYQEYEKEQLTLKQYGKIKRQ